MPTVACIKQDISELIDSGRVCMGEPCSPYTVTKSSVNNGKLESKMYVVYGRKIPLLEFRKRILKKHEHFLCVSNGTVNSLSLDEVKAKLLSLGELNSEVDDPRSLLERLQQSRKLALWQQF